MAEIFYESWGPKDPDDVCARNVTIGTLLAQENGEFAEAEFFLEAAQSTDTDLAFTSIAYSTAHKRVSMVATGGTPLGKYLVTCRIHFLDGRQHDQSFWQEITA